MLTRHLAGFGINIDTYEPERRTVGAEVVARTTAATIAFGREQRAPDRLADTQILVNYRGSPAIESSEAETESAAGPIAGDRAPDCHGLRRRGLGFPLRMFDILRGTEHVLIFACTGAQSQAELTDLAAFVAENSPNGLVRSVVVVHPDHGATELPRLPIYRDAEGGFAKAYGVSTNRATLLIRPDGYVAWRGGSWRDAGLKRQLERTFGARSESPA